MFRLCLTLFYFALYQVLLLAFAAVFGAENFFAATAPVAVIFCVFFLGPLEGIVVMLGMGFLIDAVSGMPIGFNMIALLILWCASSLAASWLIGRPQWWVLGFFVLSSSWVYRIGMGFIGNWGLKSLILAPFFDAIIGLILIRVLHAALVRAKYLPSLDDASVRLSSRPSR